MDPQFSLLMFYIYGFLAVLLAVSFAGVVYFQLQKANRYICALEQASAVTGCGLVFFDKHSQFLDANTHAHAFMPDLFVQDHSSLRRKGINIKSFFNYCYDHAVDVDDNFVETLGRSYEVSGEVSGDYNFWEVIRTHNGRLCVVEAQPLNDGGIGFIILDVDNVKEREEHVLRLNQANRELFEAIEATTSGMIITKADENGQHLVTFVNRAFCELFAFEKEDIHLKDLLELCRMRGGEYLLKRLQSILKQEKGGNIELRYDNNDKANSWYDLKLTPVYDEDGQLELYVGIVSDISELKAREKEVSNGQRLDALGQLAAGVAHDFNNVLSIIDGYTRLTMVANEGNPKAIGYLEKIKTATDRGANLIKRMLTFSRHKIVDEDVIDLGETIRDQEQLLQPLLNASIKFNILSDSEPMYIECGQDTITQILMNLVVNARDAMPHGGALFVEVRYCDQKSLPKELQSEDEQTYCVLSVADTGTGIEADVVERIFDPFFTTKDKDKGTGLGLSMIYGLVKQNGGLIKVDTKLGRGTAMNLYFPLTDKAPKAITGSFEDVDEISFDGFTVLLSEDEPDLRELVGNMLEERGMNVLRACDGHEALYLEDDYEGKIDLLLTDVVMPELNGVELADLLCELQPEMKVIFMSGYPARGQSAHVDIPLDSTFIAKPIVHEDLIRIIYGILTNADSGTLEGQDIRTPRWKSEGHEETPPREGYAS